jgi:predicted methyltransferase MtxX (methanogen marker protein 4)
VTVSLRRHFRTESNNRRKRQSIVCAPVSACSAQNRASAGSELRELLRAIPAAEASEGHATEAGRDITHLSVLIDDAIDSGDGDVADALRPLYLDYLVKHGAGS